MIVSGQQKSIYKGNLESSLLLNFFIAKDFLEVTKNLPRGQHSTYTRRTLGLLDQTSPEDRVGEHIVLFVGIKGIVGITDKVYSVVTPSTGHKCFGHPFLLVDGLLSTRATLSTLGRVGSTITYFSSIRLVRTRPV